MYKAIRVYVAGAISAPNPLDLFDNLRRGIDTGAQLFDLGFSPFTPHLDYQLALARKLDVTIEDFYRYSENFLDVCHAVFVVDNPRNAQSKGLEAELIRAKFKGIPVFSDLDTLVNWAQERQTNG